MGNDITRACSGPSTEETKAKELVEMKDKTIESLTTEKEEYVRSLTNLSSKEKQLNEELERLKRERDGKDAELKNLAAENQRLLEELAKLKAEIENKDLEIKELSKAKTTKTIADRLRKVLDEKGQVDAVNELQKQMEEQDRISRADKLRIAELEAKLDEIAAERARLAGSKATLEAQLAEMLDKATKSQVDTESGKQQLQAKLINTSRDLTVANDKIADLEKQLAQMTSLQVQLQGLLTENESLKEQLSLSALNLSLGPDVHRELAELYYVRARIIGARNLPLPEMNRMRRPYATFNIQDKIKKTKVVDNNNNPDWNEEFVFFLEKKPKNFKVMIFDFDDTREDASYDQLGACSEPLNKFFNGESGARQTFTGEIKLESPQYPGIGSVLVIEYECRVVPQVVVRWMSGYQDDHEKIARLLTYVACNVNEFDKTGRTPLMNAAIRDQPDAAQIFIRSGANVDMPDQAESKLTALMYAAIYGNIRTASVLLNKGRAMIESRDALKRTPLMLASQNGRVNVAELLLSHGAQLEATYQGGSTSLMLAAAEGHTPMVQCLVEHKANLEAKNTMGMTALALTAMRDIADVTRCLVEAQANTETRDTNGLTPLMIASLRGQTNVINVLINGGCDIEAQDPNGRTAMMYAGFQGQLEVIKLLAIRGAALLVTDHNDQTAAQIAKQSGKLPAHDLLKILEDPNNVKQLMQNPNIFTPQQQMMPAPMTTSQSQSSIRSNTTNSNFSRSPSAVSVRK